MDSAALKLEFEKTNQNIQDVMEFLRDHTPTKKEMEEGFSAIRSEMATKAELREGLNGLRAEMATKAELREGLNGLRAEMKEGFAQITIRLDFMQKEIADIKNRLDSLAQRTKEDADAQGKEILSLRKRVEYLEQQIKLLQT